MPNLMVGQERLLQENSTAGIDWYMSYDPRVFVGLDGWFLFLAAIQVFNFVVFLIGYFCLHISIIDVSWGLMPIVSMIILLVDKIVFLGASSITATDIIATVLISIWGMRLAWLIAARYHGADERYVELEKPNASCPEPCKGFQVWFQIFCFQATISVLMVEPAIRIFWFSQTTDSLGAAEIAGIVVWVIGFTFEIVGDHQLTQFVKSPNKKPGQIIDTGLWRYTRHPNYFGECLLWYGIYILACGGSTGPAGGYWTFYAPMIMNFMLRCFSGVLILEAKQKRKPAFRVYMMETNCFVPWCYKKIEEGKERDELIEKFKIEIEQELKAQEGSFMFGLFKKEWRKFLYKGGPQDGKAATDFTSVAVDTERDVSKYEQQKNEKVVDIQMVNTLNVDDQPVEPK